MRSPLKIGLNLLTIGLIGMGVYNANRAEAVNTQPEGWKLNTNLEAVNTLDTSTSYNGCYVVQNGVNRFVPTRTNGEWNSFKAAPLGTIVTPCVEYNTYYYTGDVGDGCGGAGDCSG